MLHGIQHFVNRGATPSGGSTPFVIRGARVLRAPATAAPATAAPAAAAPEHTDLARADVRVGAGGRVETIAADLAPLPGEEVVDATGLVLAPGFVDLHSHSDLYSVLRDSQAAPVGDQPKLLQGCTAQVFGQDGISAAPVAPGSAGELAAAIAGLDGSIPADRWSWATMADYLAALRGASATRVAALVGHSTIRRLVMGVAARPPTDAELDRMCTAVDQAMADGALGLSTGLVYAPAAYAAPDELVALCRVVARRGGRFFVHVRSESDRVVEATEEILDVARRSGVHLHYSHIKTAGRANWPKAHRLLELVEEHRAAGFPVTVDVHPYTAGSTTATVLVPPWVLAGGTSEALGRLRDPAVREQARRQMLSDTTSWDNWWAFSGGWEGLVVAGAPRPGLAGRSFADLIAAAGVADQRSPAAFDVVFDLLAACNLAVSLISFNNVEENVAAFLSRPYAGIGTDALVNPDGHPHPRLYGTFPRVLGRYVRELGVLDLSHALHAMTEGAAAAAGWEGPGRLAPGAAADLVAFDPERVIDRATYDEPRLPPLGIERVWVQGRLVVEGGVLTGAAPPAEEPRGVGGAPGS